MSSPAKHGPSDVQRMLLYQANQKSMGVAYLLWFFLGGFGGHRFYAGRTGSAVAMLVIALGSIIFSIVAIGLLGFLLIGPWVLIDAFLIPGWIRTHNQALAVGLTP